MCRRASFRRPGWAADDAGSPPQGLPFTTLDAYAAVHAQEAERLKALLAQVEIVEDALTGVRWVLNAPTDWSKLELRMRSPRATHTLGQ